MNLFETLVSTFQNPALGNLFLLLAAVIGVAGNYRLYQNRQSHRRDTMRVALLSEIISMQPAVRDLDHQTTLNEMNTHFPEFFLSNNVYDSIGSELGLLTEEEVSVVVDFYTKASKVQAVGKREPGNVFVEASDRELFGSLLTAAKEIEKHVDSSKIDTGAMDDPLATAESELFI